MSSGDIASSGMTERSRRAWLRFDGSRAVLYASRGNSTGSATFNVPQDGAIAC